jgi:hypothetical protein
MASYTRLGNYLLANELTADPFGKVHRGLTLTGSSFERHVLIRTFSEEVLEAGFATKVDESSRVASLLGGQRGFGHGFKVEGGRTPHVVCDYVPGRSLAQMLEKAKQEQIPLGVDHALSVLQGVAQSLVQLHSKGISHGTLSPHSIWVSFEGATQILDAPFGGSLQSLLPKCPIAAASLSRYRTVAGTSLLQADLFSLGAIFYELLTLDKLPSPELLSPTLAKATLKAAQEDGPVPQEILGLLKRLLGVDKVFESPSAFSTELERVLYDGDYSPTTFNMAFFMHTLFREENEHDNQSMKADQIADFSPFLESEPNQRKIFETAGGQSYTKYVVWGGAAVVLILAFFGWKTWDASKKAEKATQELAMLQRTFAENEAKLADLNRQEMLAKNKAAEVEQKLSTAKTKEEKDKLRKEQEAEKQKLAQIQQQKEETQKSQQQLQQRVQTVAQASPAAQPPRPAATQPAPTEAAPSLAAPAINPSQLPSQLPKNLPNTTTPATQTAPQQAAPQQATPQQAATTPQQPSAAPAQAAASDTSETPVTMTRRAAPVPPRTVNKNFLPPALRSSDIKVSVKVFVDQQGRPLKVVVDKGVEGTFGYNDSAKQAAYESSYSPATKGGKPVNGWITVEYNFGKPK